MNEIAQAVGGKILGSKTSKLLWIALIGFTFMAWRFVFGLGPVTGLNDGYPWGLWIAWDVVVGTALACGGYAVAILCYIMNKGKYHPLVRSAVVTSALGYSMAGLSIVIDVGRYWNLWKVIVFPGKWNFNSALLEVALCVMAYVVVLWIELSPAFLEKWKAGSPSALQKFAAKASPVVDKLLLPILVLGLILPTMHQSSLGSVMLVAMQKLSPIWHSPLLPLLFLISCIGMGFAIVVFESTLSCSLLKRPQETHLLSGLGKAAIGIMAIWLILRFADLIWRDQLTTAFNSGWLTFFWLLEMLAIIFGVLLLLKNRTNPATLMRAAMLLMFGGALYRFNTYLIGFNPGQGWHYFPSVPEFFITVGIVSLEILLYIIIIRRLPILVGVHKHRRL